MHSLECNFGMGMIDAHFYHTSGSKPADRRVALDRFFAATVAFGHPGYLLPERHAAQRHYRDIKVGEEEFRSYYLLQAIAARYTVADVRDIRYATAGGKFVSTGEALLSADCDKMQVVSRYCDGTVTAANGSTGRWLKAGMVELPPNGLFALSGDKKTAVWIGEKNGSRAEFAVAPGYVYFNGRGTFARFPGCASDGIVVRLPVDGKSEEVIPFAASRIELPFAATKIEMLDEEGKVCGTVPISVEDGRTVIVPGGQAVSYRVFRKADMISALEACSWVSESSGTR
jgi:hypothetical protein